MDATGTQTKEGKAEVEQFRADHKKRIDAVVKALVAGAHSLYVTPIIVNKQVGSKINRLPLLSYVNHENSRYFVLSALARHYKASMSEVGFAVQQIQSQHLAYVDTIGIDASDVKGLQDIFDEALLKRGDGGVATASLDSRGKVYIRDLKCPKPIVSKGSRKPIVAPDWLTSGIADDPDRDTEHQLAPADD